MKNEEPDEENVAGGVGDGNCFWVDNNGIGLQEERSPGHSTYSRTQRIITGQATKTEISLA
jgi:hypothetical protein